MITKMYMCISWYFLCLNEEEGKRCLPGVNRFDGVQSEAKESFTISPSKKTNNNNRKGKMKVRKPGVTRTRACEEKEYLIGKLSGGSLEQ